ncbi:TPA: hypothetical protein LU182_004255 [Enterobacter hormaechei subsp. xiangfangensis]|nr:hypothetical protein [Enterobacter hormaechei subsp. xiangfangensis]HBM2586958.1 hypothetical protein [Enterobacter hormaechei subsp. xiangfangensis]HBM2871085.1 hypothetical protein [Enterobacter hormaechei subsp. xiangfangensis]
MWWVVAAMAAKAVLGAGSEMKASKAQNTAAMTQLAKGVTQINLNRTASRQRTAQALYNTQLQADQVRSQIGLQSAASDTIGASVQDAVSTVNVQEDRQTSSINRQQAQTEEQLRLQVDRAIDDTSARMDWESGSDKLWNGLLSMGGQALGQYAGGAMSSLGSSSGESSGSAEPQSTNSTGYDLWGSQGSGGKNGQVQSWKSYLGSN